MLWVLLGAILVTGCANILTDVRGHKAAKYVTKPLTMLLVIALLFAVGPPHDATYLWLVLAALVFSLAGDVFLMLERDLFVFGLGSFLVAHLVFIVAFAEGVPLDAGLVWLAPVLAYGGLMLAWLWKDVPARLRIPVVVYVLAILAMGWRAFARGESARFESTSAQLVVVGGVLFMASDSVLAIRRFRGDFRGAQIAVLTTYFSAQVCFALSAVRLSEVS